MVEIRAMVVGLRASRDYGWISKLGQGQPGQRSAGQGAVTF